MRRSADVFVIALRRLVHYCGNKLIGLKIVPFLIAFWQEVYI